MGAIYRVKVPSAAGSGNADTQIFRKHDWNDSGNIESNIKRVVKLLHKVQSISGKTLY